MIGNPAWVDQIAAWKRQHPYLVDPDTSVIQPQQAVQAVCGRLGLRLRR